MRYLRQSSEPPELGRLPQRSRTQQWTPVRLQQVQQKLQTQAASAAPSAGSLGRQAVCLQHVWEQFQDQGQLAESSVHSHRREEVFLRTVRAAVRAQDEPHAALSLARWPQTLRVPRVQEEVLAEWQSARALADPLWRKALLLRLLRTQIHYLISVQTPRETAYGRTAVEVRILWEVFLTQGYVEVPYETSQGREAVPVRPL